MKPWKEGVILTVIAGGLVSGFIWIGSCNGSQSDTLPPAPPNPWPEGMRTKTVITAVISGEATRAVDAVLLSWRGQKHVRWSWLIEFETTVLRNDGNLVELERTFTKVRQSLKVLPLGSKTSFPRNVLLEFVGDFIWKHVPPELKVVADLIRALSRGIDPNGEIMAKAVEELAKAMGADIDAANAERLLEADKLLRVLEGLTVRLTSVDGLGNVGGVEWVATGEKRSELEQLGKREKEVLEQLLEQHAGVLLAAPLLEDFRTAKIKDKVEVPADKIGIPLDLGRPLTIAGKLTFERKEPEPDTSNGMKRFVYRRGRINYFFDRGKTKAAGWFGPDIADFTFDPDHLLFRHGYMKGAGQYEFTKDHWLVDVEFRGRPSVVIQFWTELLPDAK